MLLVECSLGSALGVTSF